MSSPRDTYTLILITGNSIALRIRNKISLALKNDLQSNHVEEFRKKLIKN